jgi:hypothetical protein
VVLRPGDVVDVRFTKWGGGRHWEFPVTVLGTDEAVGLAWVERWRHHQVGAGRSV